MTQETIGSVELLKYVSIHEIDAHLALGWLAIPETSYCHHSDFSILMRWVCQCPIREPESRPRSSLSPSTETETAQPS